MSDDYDLDRADGPSTMAALRDQLAAAREECERLRRGDHEWCAATIESIADDREVLQARLAAVEALRQEAERRGSPFIYVTEVRAALASDDTERGE